MIRLVIADDRLFELNKLKSIMDWAAYGMEIVGEAQNGREAFDLCLNERADILITDIKMPVMDGLELAKILSGTIPDLKIILLSAYSDFQYAKRAIELNVCGYVLKPYTQQDLIEALSRASAEIAETAMRRQREQSYNNFFNGNIAELRKAFLYESMTSAAIDEHKFWNKAGTLGIQFESDSFVLLSVAAEGARAFHRKASLSAGALCSEIKKCVSKYVKYFYLLTDGDCILVLLNLDDNLLDGDEQSLISAVSADISHGISKLKQRVRIKTSRIGYGITCWNKLYTEVTAEAVFHEVSASTIEGVYLQYKELEPELFAAVTQKDTALALKNVSVLIDQAQEQGLSASHLIKICLSAWEEANRLMEKNHCINTAGVMQKESLSKLLDFSSAEDIKAWLEQLFRDTEKLVGVANLSKSAQKVETALNIIHNQYSDPNIDLVQVSSRISLSPNYLSVIFKEQTGKSFSAYLTEYRIQKACEMLTLSADKIADIPEAVGLSNNPHFYFLFKRLTGCTPGEYRFRNKTV